jgi:hypothetical protein
MAGRHGLLLRTRRQRPSHRAAEPCNELPPSCSITSSALSRIDDGTSRPRVLAVLMFKAISATISAFESFDPPPAFSARLRKHKVNLC